jgi:hypothetical protein
MKEHHMKKSLLVVVCAVLSLVSISAFAAAAPGMGYMVGFKNADYDVDGSETTSKPGLMAGVITVIEMGGLNLRTGGYYAERKGETEGATTDTEFSISYVDVPVTALFNMNDYFGVFAGAVAGLKVADDNVNNAESLYLAGTVGLRAVFGPNWAGEFSYEMGLTEVADNTDVNSMSLNVQFLY